MVRALFADEYLTITFDTDSRVVRFVRNDKRYPSMEVVRAEHVALASAIAHIVPKEHALLIDVRVAPPRNDEAFEAEITRLVTSLVNKFKKHAFLVQTAVGTLQVRRLSAVQGSPAAATFSDEGAALTYLTSQDKP
jgi:hypothetical protein